VLKYRVVRLDRIIFVYLDNLYLYFKYKMHLMRKAVKNDNTDLSSGRMGYQFNAKSHQISKSLTYFPNCVILYDVMLTGQ
jgi:hypothetical protein